MSAALGRRTDRPARSHAAASGSSRRPQRPRAPPDPAPAHDYSASPEPALLRVPEGRYLTMAGEGPPGSAEFQSRLQALFNVVYALKFAVRRRGRDFRVPALEAVWVGIPGAPGPVRPGQEVRWRLEMPVPNFVSDGDVERTERSLIERGKSDLVREVVVAHQRSTTCVRALHVGPYRSETATVKRMMRFVDDRGLRITGLHREIYLTDPRRVPEARLRTILQYPVGRRRATPTLARPSRPALFA